MIRKLGGLPVVFWLLVNGVFLLGTVGIVVN